MLRKANISSTEQSIYDLSGISNETFLIISLIVYGVLCTTIDLCGMITNIINIICFVKQGFRDSVNVSLLGMMGYCVASGDTYVFDIFIIFPSIYFRVSC